MISKMSAAQVANLLKWIQSHGNACYVATDGRIAIKSAVRMADGTMGFETDHCSTKSEVRTVLGY